MKPRKLLFILGAVCTSAAGASGLAAPAPTLTEALQPSSAWRIDYAENECRLIRTFGADNSLVTLRIARGGTSDAFDSVIAGPGVPRLSQQVSVTIGLDPQGVQQTLSGYSLAVPKTKDRFVRWYDADARLISNFQLGDRRAFACPPQCSFCATEFMAFSSDPDSRSTSS